MDINVVGTHRVGRAPERGTLHVTLSWEADRPQTAMAHLRTATASVTDELDALRTDPARHLVESSISGPRTRRWRQWLDHGIEGPERFSASCDVTAVFDDEATLARIASRWADRAGWTIWWVRWTLTDESRLAMEDQALSGAVEDAHRRAQVIALAAGKRQVTIASVSDPTMGRDDAYAQSRTLMAKAPMGGGEDELHLSPEEVEVTATVHARFTAT